MSDDSRKITIKFRVNDEENKLLEEKFLMSKCRSKSQFMRAMIFKGFIIKFDDKKLKNISRNISGIASNINQIAVRVNSTGNIYSEDISQIKKDINELWQQQRYFQSELQKFRQ
ncbi:MAG: MobC family plasmid mobilization relaxosome protein [Ruminococcus sp.]|nr:MobC family plasmid mobilization relaxosome protein [Ruminococcus sp.]